MDNVVVRAIEPADLAQLLVMNNDAAPAVNELDLPRLAELVTQSEVATAAVVDGDLRGMLLALRPGEPYDSANYRWFSERYDDFLYVDRVIVSEQWRGGGVGDVLYRDLLERADGLVGQIACEVNLEPPNPGSLRFHHKRGFAEVGQQPTGEGGKLVSLMIRPV
ncbi:GNAT family N-acetyltransferase [Herbihabitans rhizosphaerae]|uniref:GNAT family N-acetyltransferase n=1 Tax=Herbihabitans rhizosphaerae TaxID=1872711 RepID=UPI00102AEFB9|nr:GNAT family N-acetyltransferase [Herbihabitans rhizosphaerae]